MLLYPCIPIARVLIRVRRRYCGTDPQDSFSDVSLFFLQPQAWLDYFSYPVQARSQPLNILQMYLLKIPFECLAATRAANPILPGYPQMTVGMFSTVLRLEWQTGRGRLTAFQITADGKLDELGHITTPQGAAYHVLYNSGSMIANMLISLYPRDYDRPALTLPSYCRLYWYIRRYGPKPHPSNAGNKTRARHSRSRKTSRTGTAAPSYGRAEWSLSPFTRSRGADYVRVFDLGKQKLQEVEGLSLPKGSFPRHVAWVTLRTKIQLYVLLQEPNALLTYQVEYAETGGLTFVKEDEFSLLTAPDGSSIVWTAENEIKASHLDVSVSSINSTYVKHRITIHLAG